MKDNYTAADFNRTLVTNKAAAQRSINLYCNELETIVSELATHLDWLKGYANRLHDTETANVDTVADTLENIAMRMVNVEGYIYNGRFDHYHRKVSRAFGIYEMFSDLDIDD